MLGVASVSTGAAGVMKRDYVMKRDEAWSSMANVSTGTAGVALTAVSKGAHTYLLASLTSLTCSLTYLQVSP